MRIKTIPSLFDAIEKMLQGLCYWMGYRYECYSGHPITEFAAIDIAVGVLNAHIDHSTYAIRKAAEILNSPQYDEEVKKQTAQGLASVAAALQTLDALSVVTTV